MNKCTHVDGHWATPAPGLGLLSRAARNASTHLPSGSMVWPSGATVLAGQMVKCELPHSFSAPPHPGPAFTPSPQLSSFQPPGSGADTPIPTKAIQTGSVALPKDNCVLHETNRKESTSPPPPRPRHRTVPRCNLRDQNVCGSSCLKLRETGHHR